MTSNMATLQKLIHICFFKDRDCFHDAEVNKNCKFSRGQAILYVQSLMSQRHNVLFLTPANPEIMYAP